MKFLGIFGKHPRWHLVQCGPLDYNCVRCYKKVFWFIYKFKCSISHNELYGKSTMGVYKYIVEKLEG